MGCVGNKKQNNHLDNRVNPPIKNGTHNSQQTPPKHKKLIRTQASIEEQLQKQRRIAPQKNENESPTQPQNPAGDNNAQEERQNRIRQSYQLDLDEEVPQTSKIQTFHYEKLFVHNPEPVVN